jgi:hypothetical protein
MLSGAFRAIIRAGVPLGTAGRESSMISGDLQIVKERMA